MSPTVRRPASVATRLFLWQLLLLTAVVVAGTTVAVVHEQHRTEDEARHTVSDVAQSLALSDGTVAALRDPDPSAVLQPETERIRVATGVDFIVVMTPDRVRYTHTDPSRIGGRFTGTIEPALRGDTFTETYEGSLGPSVRAVSPVYAGDELVGLVSVGLTTARIGSQVTPTVATIVAIAAAGLVVAAAGSLALSRRLRRQTLGLGPDELRRLYEHHDAVLHSMGEGLVVLDENGAVGVVNDEARRLLGIGSGPVTADDVPDSLTRGPHTAPDDRGEVHLVGDRVLVVRRQPLHFDGRDIGTVLTLRDRTELQTVLGELDSVRGFAQALESQAHESANRMHTLITMIELGRYDDAVQFATDDLRLSQGLIDRLTSSVHEPALAALLLGKVGAAATHGVELTVTDGTALDSSAPLTPHELVTVVGNLVDNAVDAAADQPGDGWVEVGVHRDAGALTVSVTDSGAGMSADEFARATERGYSTKPTGHGLGLALVTQVVRRHGGTIRSVREPESRVVVEIPDDRGQA
ncbi:sensor histidine kinase [Rhodococcus sp. HNM0569]|uniref:sensor histidine kinase n=1 Tax=Rhodococcus sp. HNM0569 TaxID=2716340 RepID=UPI003211E191